MGLLDWARHTPENYRMMDRIRLNWDDMQIVDLQTPLWIDDHPYVARVGLFTEDMMYVNIPDLVWHCNDQGKIYPVWRERLPFKGERWKKERKRLERDARRAGREILGIGDLYERRKMLASIRTVLQSYTEERWIQHKMASDTLLKGPFRQLAKPTMR